MLVAHTTLLEISCHGSFKIRLPFKREKQKVFIYAFTAEQAEYWCIWQMMLFFSKWPGPQIIYFELSFW